MGRWKNGRIEKILIFLTCVWLEVERWKNGKMAKMSLYKFIYMPLLKNAQLKKSDKEPTKKKKKIEKKRKRKTPKFIKKEKSCLGKK